MVFLHLFTAGSGKLFLLIIVLTHFLGSYQMNDEWFGILFRNNGKHAGFGNALHVCSIPPCGQKFNKKLTPLWDQIVCQQCRIPQGEALGRRWLLGVIERIINYKC